MELLRVIREEQGDFAKFESALAKAKPEDLTQPIQDGRNILHIICASGFTKYAQLLINAASKKQVIAQLLDSKEEKDQQTPLFFAIRSAPNGFPEIISLLIKSECNVNLRDKFGRCALHYACEQGQDDTLQILIQHGAEPNFQDFEDKRTPLHQAILNGQFNAVSILCEQGKANANIADKKGDSLLHYAAVTQGNASLYIRYLIEKQQISPLIKNNEGLNPRELAEKLDKKKFHRVIKNLKNYELKELAKKKPEKVIQIKTVYKYENGIIPMIMNNQLISIGLPLLIAILIYLIERFLF